ncbi:MAG: hypothetical protein UHU21_04455, partial [Lachnospiraceae bacterium]|nr:hypothetical protein [Lachnospiraceae bacterium]
MSILVERGECRDSEQPKVVYGECRDSEQTKGVYGECRDIEQPKAVNLPVWLIVSRSNPPQFEIQGVCA